MCRRYPMAGNAGPAASGVLSNLRFLERPKLAVPLNLASLPLTSKYLQLVSDLLSDAVIPASSGSGSPELPPLNQSPENC